MDFIESVNPLIYFFDIINSTDSVLMFEIIDFYESVVGIFHFKSMALASSLESTIISTFVNCSFIQY